MEEKDKRQELKSRKERERPEHAYHYRQALRFTCRWQHLSPWEGRRRGEWRGGKRECGISSHGRWGKCGGGGEGWSE